MLHDCNDSLEFLTLAHFIASDIQNSYCRCQRVCHCLDLMAQLNYKENLLTKKYGLYKLIPIFNSFLVLKQHKNTSRSLMLKGAARFRSLLFDHSDQMIKIQNVFKLEAMIALNIWNSSTDCHLLILVHNLLTVILVTESQEI